MQTHSGYELNQQQRCVGIISSMLRLIDVARNALHSGETEKAAEILDSMMEIAVSRKNDPNQDIPAGTTARDQSGLPLRGEPVSTEGIWLRFNVQGVEFRLKASEVLPVRTPSLSRD